MDDRDTKFNAVLNIFHEAESKAYCLSGRICEHQR